MKFSIKRQFALIYGGTMVGMILLCILANTVLLSSFYMDRKQKVLKVAYDNICEYLENNNLTTESADAEFGRLAGRYNLDVLVLDSDTKTEISSVNDSRFLADRLLEYVFRGPMGAKELYSNGVYTIQIVTDQRLHMEYIELWGFASSSKIIYMRSPVEGIRDSAKIANTFLTYVGLAVLVFGLIVNEFFSGRISRPIMELADISEKMTNLDFDAKYTRGGYDEIALLGDHINQMSMTLERTISELKEANIELKNDLDRKIEIDEMRKEFLANVSHELKTPIALIQGYSEGLKDCVNSDEDSRDYYCDVIIDEANKMNKLVRNLLELNQLEFGNDNVEMERFDIVELVRNCVQANMILIEQLNIKIEEKFEAESIYVWSDEFKVEQVINNYLSNAIHYCKNENIISIGIKKVDAGIRVSVYNSGDNILAEAIPHLWTKFYKVDKARTREYGGSGIGLSIVKAVMDSLKHDYGVINRDNGVEFWCELDADLKNKRIS